MKIKGEISLFGMKGRLEYVSSFPISLKSCEHKIIKDRSRSLRKKYICSAW